jgi:hypothetical protein
VPIPSYIRPFFLPTQSVGGYFARASKEVSSALIADRTLDLQRQPRTAIDGVRDNERSQYSLMSSTPRLVQTFGWRIFSRKTRGSATAGTGVHGHRRCIDHAGSRRAATGTLALFFLLRPSYFKTVNVCCRIHSLLTYIHRHCTRFLDHWDPCATRESPECRNQCIHTRLRS